MPPYQLTAIASGEALSVVITSSPGMFPPPPPLQTANGAWVETSAFYAGGGVTIDYENVVHFKLSRRLLAILPAAKC